MKEKMNKIPVFYACDDNFVKYTMVSLQSMICLLYTSTYILRDGDVIEVVQFMGGGCGTSLMYRSIM